MKSRAESLTEIVSLLVYNLEPLLRLLIEPKEAVAVLHVSWWRDPTCLHAIWHLGADRSLAWPSPEPPAD